jgi:hypothetical protein
MPNLEKIVDALFLTRTEEEVGARLVDLSPGQRDEVQALVIAKATARLERGEVVHFGGTTVLPKKMVEDIERFVGADPDACKRIGDDGEEIFDPTLKDVIQGMIVARTAGDEAFMQTLRAALGAELYDEIAQIADFFAPPFGGTASFVCSEDMSDWPTDTDGEGMMCPVSIGTRDKLTEQAARENADLWREAVRRYPKAMFQINLLGFDQDPREIWEIEDAARYVRWWARYAGMDDFETADRWIGVSSAMGDTSGLGFLAVCGVFGDEAKRIVLSQRPSTPEH